MTIFLFKLSLCWVFFALLYRLFLRQETFFKANRAYLLGTLVLGILLAVWPAEQIPVPIEEDTLPAFTLPEFSIGVQQAEQVTNQWFYLDGLRWIYWAGVCWMVFRLLWGLAKIMRMAARGRSELLEAGVILIQSEEAKVPFSFFNWVFVPVEKYAMTASADTAMMLAHERAHARARHSLDVLFMELLCAFFWFHPLVYWYRKALRAVHEYQADAAASQEVDRKQYGLLLIEQSQSGKAIAMVHHFYQSPLKQRLIMLTKKASAPVRAIKFGFLFPLTLLFAVLFRQAPVIAQKVDEKHQEFVQQLEKTGWMNVDTVITFDPLTYKESVQYVSNSLAPAPDASGKLLYYYAEVQPQFPGGEEALRRFLIENIHYPESAAKAGAEAGIQVNFVVDDDGDVESVRASAWKLNTHNDLMTEAERVVKAMPRWIPATHKGKKVRCMMRLPVDFSLSAKASKSVTAQPEFPGGIDGLIKYLGENVKYPEDAKNAGAEGVVLLEFLVKKDGKIDQIAQVEGSKVAHPSLLKEAIRVVQAMPNWKPAIQDGKVVEVNYKLPIKFRLDPVKTSPATMTDVDVQPEYPGGQEAFYKFLQTNIQFPEQARKENAEGMVVIRFVVDKDGSLTDFTNENNARPDFAEEVIRVLKLSPKWKPAEKGGKTVKIQYHLPFKFKL